MTDTDFLDVSSVDYFTDPTCVRVQNSAKIVFEPHDVDGYWMLVEAISFAATLTISWAWSPDRTPSATAMRSFRESAADSGWSVSSKLSQMR